MRTVRSSYTPVQAWCHWGTVLYCVVAYPTAEAIRTSHLGHVFGVRGSSFDRASAVIHEWGGWAALALTLALLLSRLSVGGPALPDGMATWQRWAAHMTHAALYAGIAILVASGVAAMYWGGAYGRVHVLLARVGLGLVVVHVAAVLWHQFVRRDGLLLRMRPLRRPPVDD